MNERRMLYIVFDLSASLFFQTSGFGNWAFVMNLASFKCDQENVGSQLFYGFSAAYMSEGAEKKRETKKCLPRINTVLILQR